jgi:hypothetical protein
MTTHPNDFRMFERQLNMMLSSRNSNRFGHPRFLRPHWRFREMLDQTTLPNFDRLKDESDEDWTTRSKIEQKTFIESLKSTHARCDGESKNETLERIDQGHHTIKIALAELGVAIDSETQPLEWKSYSDFCSMCYKEYIQFVKGILTSEAYRNSPQKPYNPADHAAVIALGRLKTTSKHGEYYAGNINERLAKAWANGEHRPTFRKLKLKSDGTMEEYPLWEKRENELKATGITIEGGLNDFESCFYTFKDLPGKLKASCNSAEARVFSENYGPVIRTCNHEVNTEANM